MDSQPDGGYLLKNTIENLAKAFIGESQARNRYTFYSKIAKEEGFEQISELFLLTAENEREHAKWLLKLINELKKRSKESFEEIKVEAEAPTTLGDTAENLRAADSPDTILSYSSYYDFLLPASLLSCCIHSGMLTPSCG